MWDESFHRLCGFQGFGTNVTWDRVRREGDTMGVKAVRRRRRRRTRRLVECPRKQQTTTPHQWPQLFGIIILSGPQEFLQGAQAFTVNIHAHTDNPRNADNNCSYCIEGIWGMVPWGISDIWGNPLFSSWPRGFRCFTSSFVNIWASFITWKITLFFFLRGQIKNEPFNTGILDVGCQKNCFFLFFVKQDLLSLLSVCLRLFLSSPLSWMFLLALGSPVCVHQQTQEEEPATVLTDGQSQ